ncbi:MAG: GYF domain-containing protein [Verrucomicrobiales bacterium]|jgi:hypothetical protein|nr:GYF domain-containing protein [Verrucomicrobiales bacterium]
MKQWYYAKDSQKFGPFQKEFVEELYRKGELAAGDLVWEEGAPEWRAAGKVFSGKAAPSADLSVPAEFHPVDCLKRGWRLTWRHPGYFIGGAFISMLLMNAPSLVANVIIILLTVIEGMLVGAFKEQPSVIITVSIILSTIGLAAILVICGACVYPIISGCYWLMLRVTRGHAPDLADLFYGFKKPHVWELAKAGVVISLLSTLGVILLVLPGLYLALVYSFTPFLILDKKLPWREAMKLSHQTTRRNLWPLVGFALLNISLNIAGVLCCYVGIFIAIPVMFASYVYAYEILFRNQPKEQS